MNNTICLDKSYSTTRLLTKEKPSIKNNLKDKFETILFLPEAKNRNGTGGLRIKGYFKKSYENKPLVNIITVVYNGEKYLEHTIQSVIRQTYDNIEYIIIDGGSTDGTVDVIKKYEDRIDYWVSEADKGVYDAMNKGVSAANGQWIYFLGSDDILFDSIHKISNKLNNQYDAVYGDVYMPKRHILYNGRFNKLKLLFGNICHQAIFYNKKILIKNKFNLEYKIYADYALNISIYDKTKFYYHPILLAYYNDFDGISAATNDEAFRRKRPMLIIKSFGFIYYLVDIIRVGFFKFLNFLHLTLLIKKVLYSFLKR